MTEIYERFIADKQYSAESDKTGKWLAEILNKDVSTVS
jgi:hypothetical protein